MTDHDPVLALGLLTRAVAVLEADDLHDGIARFIAGVGEHLDLDEVRIDVDIEGDMASATVLPDAATSVGPGEVVVLPLVRDGRLVGRLHARAGRGLSEAELAGLRQAGGVLAVALDHDRLLRAEQTTVARLRELADMKTTFLGSVSHELRTTVTAIEGFAMLLSRQATLLSDEQRDDFVNRIRRNARSLGTLVEDLLDMARLEGSGMKVALQPVDLSELLPKVVDQMASVLDHHVVVVEVEEGLTVPCDPGAVERIVVNLLSNAARYTAPGTEVTVSLRGEPSAVVLAVADRGPGIPVAERDAIFERFHRIDNDAARQVRGVGIGLALVRELVELHGGSVVVEETPGGGSTFLVRLPRAG